MPTIDPTGEPEVVVADAVAALMPTIAALAGARGAVVPLAVLLVIQDWLALAFAGARSDEAIGAWVAEHQDEALDLATQASMVLRLRVAKPMGNA